MQRDFFRALAALLVSSFLFMQHSFAAPSASTELKIGVVQEFENLNPLISTMAATNYILYLVSRPMISLDAAGKWQPMLVTQIPSLENGLAQIYEEKGKKKLKAQWEILPTANWGDGKPITAKDVEFTWQVGMNKNVSVGAREAWENMEKIVIDPVNPKKFTLIYKEARWKFNQDDASFMLLPQHLEDSIVKNHGKQASGYEKNSLYTTKPTSPGLYNGPYLVKEIKLGSHVTVVANPHFFGKKPSIPQMTLKLIPNTATLEANLRSGSIDMISSLGMTFDQALSFDKKVKSEKMAFEVQFKQGLVYEHIDLQLNNEMLKDVKVRKALVHAINRDDLSKALFEGKQNKAIHNISPIDPWYTEDPTKIVLYEASRRKANALLDEAGWVKGTDGYRYKNGKKLSFQIMTTAGDKTRELVQTFLQEQWKMAGIEIVIKNEPARVYFGETVRKAKYPAMAMYAWISSPEMPPRANLHSSNIPTEKNGMTGQNTMSYKSAEVDQLLDQLQVEFDAKKRLELNNKILYHYTNDVPVIPLYYRSDVAITPKKLAGHRLTGTLVPPTVEAENWELKNTIVN